MSLVVVATETLGAGFPRVSGDEPQRAGKTAVLGRFSPRERG